MSPRQYNVGGNSTGTLTGLTPPSPAGPVTGRRARRTQHPAPPSRHPGPPASLPALPHSFLVFLTLEGVSAMRSQRQRAAV